MIFKFLILSLFPLTILAESYSVVPEVFYSEDTDGSQVTKESNTLRYNYNETDYLGISAGYWNFQDTDGKIGKAVFSLSGGWRFNNFLIAKGEIYSWNEFTLYDSLFVYSDNTWRLEGSVEKSIMDSSLSIEKKITAQTFSGSVDYELSKEWTFSGLIQIQRISDGNTRLTKGASVIYSWIGTGFSALVKTKVITSDYDPQEYFAPESLKRRWILLGYVTGIYHDRLVLRAFIGPGIQIINQDKGESMLNWDVSIHGDLTKNTLIKVRYLCNSDGGEYSYRYCSLGTSLGFRW